MISILAMGITVAGKTNALYRGRVAVRPWRIGLLVDVEDAEQVTRAITQLSRVWGGMYMPILDVKADLDSLRKAAGLFDVDSLYAENPSEELREFLDSSGYGWRGRGEFGPLAGGRGVRVGLLHASTVDGESGLESASWRGPSEPSLAVSAYLGARDEGNDQSRARPILETTRLLKLSTSYVRHEPRGFVVLRDESARDATFFWNCRVMSDGVFPLLTNSSDFNTAVVADVVDLAGFRYAAPPEGAPAGLPHVYVYGYEDLATVEQQHLKTWATESEVELVPWDREDAFDRTWFPGFERIASRRFRVETDPTSRLIPVDVPQLPLRKAPRMFQGIVAAEVHFHEASGVDPRFTVDIPPFRRLGALIARPGYGADQTRISGVGPVFGLHADIEEISVSNAFQLDVMRLLFDDDKVVVGQSDDGKFQTRAAEIFGGPLGGHLAQPGVRAAIQAASRTPTGMTLSHLERVVQDNRGEWPDPIFTFGQTPTLYAKRQVQALLSSGLLVPYLQIQCPQCRITLRLATEQLGTTLECEFCGSDVRLALALALTKPAWVFRLAGHLSPEKVEALLPAMAASAVLARTDFVEGPPASHVLGLEVQLPNRRKIEVDVAIFMPRDRMVVLGEVKNHNRIDANDIGNLFQLCNALIAKGLRAIPLFATFNEGFPDELKQAVRAELDTAPHVVDIYGQPYPLMPLLLTRRELSLPPLHDDHPWRWSSPGSGAGLVAVAFESTRRHLGLADVIRSPAGTPQFVWQPDTSPMTPEPRYTSDTSGPL